MEMEMEIRIEIETENESSNRPKRHPNHWKLTTAAGLSIGI